MQIGLLVVLFLSGANLWMTIPKQYDHGGQKGTIANNSVNNDSSNGYKC